MLRALAISKMLILAFLTPFGVIRLFSCNWVFNEADTFKASSILIYLKQINQFIHKRQTEKDRQRERERERKRERERERVREIERRKID